LPIWPLLQESGLLSAAEYPLSLLLEPRSLEPRLPTLLPLLELPKPPERELPLEPPLDPILDEPMSFDGSLIPPLFELLDEPLMPSL